MTTSLPTRRWALPVVALLLVAPHVGAATFTVGPLAQGCTHATPQDAVNAAQGTVGGDVIRISRLTTWTAQQVNINVADSLEIAGGYPNCTATTPSGGNTTLDGTGGQARPVITVRGNGVVNLRRLDITGGDQGGGDNGGGVFYEGNGILEINDCGITENLATDGGGIYAQGTGTLAELIIGANVTVGFNTARNSGGGIYSKSIETSIRGPGSTLIMNEALGQGGGTSGGGGGLAVVSGAFKSVAYVSSNGIGDVGAIFGNKALYGGGVAVVSGPESAREADLRVFSADADRPVRINQNTAVLTGGGIYARPDADETSGDAFAYVRLWHAAIDDNIAASGAAISLDYDDVVAPGFSDLGAFLQFNPAPDPAVDPGTLVRCAVGRPCGYIRGNIASEFNGATVRVHDGAVAASRVAVTGNTADRLFAMLGDDVSFRLENALLARNTLAQQVVHSDTARDRSNAVLRHVTIADNVIGAPHVISVAERLILDRSLVWQPGRNLIAPGGIVSTMDYVLANEVSNTGGGAFVIANPRFIDPVRGDYHLRAGAQAVDFAPHVDAGVDLDGRAHTINMPLGGIAGRTADVGAFERPTLQPLVLNPDYDADLNLWDLIGSDSSWDGTTNASGPSGSGAQRVSLALDDAIVASRVQCVHLPGPGTYRLNGWGRVTDGAPVDNTVRLEWELRYNGGAAGCTDGAPEQEGIHVLSRTPTWTRPATADEIVVPAASWTRNTSLAIYTVVINGNPVKSTNTPAGSDVVGWFDGIRLEIDTGDIFEDSFE